MEKLDKMSFNTLTIDAVLVKKSVSHVEKTQNLHCRRCVKNGLYSSIFFNSQLTLTFFIWFNLLSCF